MQQPVGYDYIIVGAGFAGATAARCLAEGGKKVCVLEKRSHIGGNAYDCFDENGVFIHRYGPHIFHTHNSRVYEFISRFTDWIPYEHRVKASINGNLVPVPFNLDSIKICFAPDKAQRLTEKLTALYRDGEKITITLLRESADSDIKEIAAFVYENIFLHYTMKQWGCTPDEIDPQVIGRVPVLISHDDRYFQDPYQGIPSEGYTSLFKRMLFHENIKVVTEIDALEHISVADGTIKYDGNDFSGGVIYTGAPDELYGFCYGALPYRTLDFSSQTLDIDYFQPCATVNYTVSEDFTRITEFKHMTGQKIKGKTTIMKEYPREYDRKNGDIPYYPLIGGKAAELYSRYAKKATETKGLYLLGRLAEYRYYNMDGIIAAALELTGRLLKNESQK